MELPQDWKEFLSFLDEHRVRFLLVGGHAMAAHGTNARSRGSENFVSALAGEGIVSQPPLDRAPQQPFEHLRQHR
jgi:hypothetical protein